MTHLTIHTLSSLKSHTAIPYHLTIQDHDRNYRPYTSTYRVFATSTHDAKTHLHQLHPRGKIANATLLSQQHPTHNHDPQHSA